MVPSPDPLWKDLLPLAGVVIGALLARLSSTSSWRRGAAHEALLDVYTVRRLMWKPGPSARAELEHHLHAIEARLKVLGQPERGRTISRAVSKFQQYVQAEVDVNVLGELEEVSSAMQAPKGTLEAAQEEITRDEEVLLALMKPFGGFRAKRSASRNRPTGG